MTPDELYTGLIGGRVKNHELAMPGFTEVDYEDLLLLIVESVEEHIGPDYYEFLARRARQYHRERAKKRTYEDFYDPLVERSPEELTVRQQLAILKHFIGRLKFSRYLGKEKGR